MSTCKIPPPGWRCSREPGHEGPCAAHHEAEVLYPFPHPSPVHESGCLTELWHVQCTRKGGLLGYYQFFHPNEAAAREEADRLRSELGQFGWNFHVCRFVLAEVVGQ